MHLASAVVETTPGSGHSERGAVVESGVSATQHSTDIHVAPSRPVRCFRHHRVSMASCDECRRIRTAQLAREREAAKATS